MERRWHASVYSNMYKFRLLMIAGMLSTLATLAGAANGATPQKGTRSAVQPAAWIPHDLIVSFDHLPKVYSCDDLWYKFRDVLRAIGARSDMRILAYQCGAQYGALAHSPQVHVHFFIPQALNRAQSKWADINAQTRTVRLGPGNPASLTSADCELLRQMKDGLLAALPDRVTGFNLACAAPA